MNTAYVLFQKQLPSLAPLTPKNRNIVMKLILAQQYKDGLCEVFMFVTYTLKPTEGPLRLSGFFKTLRNSRPHDSRQT